MTLKELFRKVDFDYVWPEVLLIDPKMANSALGMKQAFDQIRVITPEVEEKPEIIKVIKVEEADGIYIRVSSCSNHYRRIVAGREIEVEDGLNLTDEQLAAHCLWELTFWGFSDDDVAETFEELPTSKPTNKYWQEYYEKERRWFPPIPEEDWERNLTRKKNRSKRKRDYRHEKRLKQLRRLAKIEELQHYADYHSIDFSALMLRFVKSFSIATIRSYSEKPEDAMEYLIELFTTYFNREAYDYDGALVLVSGGSKVSTDMDLLYKTIWESLGKRASIHYGAKDNENITVKIIFFKGRIPTPLEIFKMLKAQLIHYEKESSVD